MGSFAEEAMIKQERCWQIKRTAYARRYRAITQHGVEGAIAARSFWRGGRRGKGERQDWERGSMSWHNDGGPQIPC